MYDHVSGVGKYIFHATFSLDSIYKYQHPPRGGVWTLRSCLVAPLTIHLAPLAGSRYNQYILYHIQNMKYTSTERWGSITFPPYHHVNLIEWNCWWLKSHSQPPGMVLKPVVNNGISTTNLNWATKKILITFHYTGCLIGILIRVYYNR